MAICRFCGQEFISAQAVRAHLKGCEAYRNRPAKPNATASLRHASLGSASLLGNALQAVDASPGAEFDPVRQLEQRLAAERLRLKLRELEEAHRELDARTQAKAEEQRRATEREAEAVRAAEREREATRLREAQGSEERQHQENGQRQRKATRREIIQQVKRETVERWAGGFWVGAELKAQMLQEIELALTRLPVEELPREELEQIARAVRDKLHARAAEAQRQSQRLAQQQQSLAQHGLDYARRELKDVDDLDLFERWRIEARVGDELKEVAGDETRADIEDWVDEILEQEGIEYDDT